jgi:hypothetical protein
MQLENNFRYLFSNSNNPALPSPVCFSPRIAINVPVGKAALVFSTIATLVRSFCRLARAIPCVVCLCSTHPALKYFGLPYRLDKYVLSLRYLYPKAWIS